MDDYRFFAEKQFGDKKGCDSALVAVVLLLCGLGLFALLICSRHYGQRMFGDAFHFIKRQLVCAALGFVFFILFATLKVEAIKKMTPAFVIGAVVLCLLVFAPGISSPRNGARRWLKMPFSFTLQPSETAKFALVFFLANFFERRNGAETPAERDVMPAVFGLFLFSGLTLAQKDFSTSVFIFFIGLLMFFASGAKLLWFFPSLLLVIPTVVIFVFLEPYRIERIIAFFRPDEGAATFNYQRMNALRAISAGGFWGNGVGTGLSQIDRIPEAQSDYIFVGWVEAMGFVGALVYFALLCLFAFLGYRAAFRCENRFASYAAFGFVSVIVAQSLANCAVACGALPATGVPLPFFSLGGSSIIVTLAMCGFIVNVSRGRLEGAEDAGEERAGYDGEHE